MRSTDTLTQNLFWNLDVDISRLHAIDVPENVKKIERHTFTDFDMLNWILFPTGIREIDKYAFKLEGPVRQAVFKGKTMDQVRSMAGYPFGLDIEAITVEP